MGPLVVLAAAAFAATRLVLPAVLPLLRSGGLTARNFGGESIPVGYGLVPALLGAAGAGFLGMLSLSGALLGFAFLGLLDDVLGDRSAGGFRGHIGELRRGRLTSGAVKAIGGAVLALAIAAGIGGGLLGVMVDGLLIALWANALNLLDVRPGRTLKAFLALATASFFLPGSPALAPLWGSALGAWPTDLGARGMLGDTGSNALGAGIGVMATGLPLSVRLGLVILLLLFHQYTEHHSVTSLIERHPVLRQLDQWGRPV